jgi:hypothetical protein
MHDRERGGGVTPASGKWQRLSDGIAWNNERLLFRKRSCFIAAQIN